MKSCLLYFFAVTLALTLPFGVAKTNEQSPPTLIVFDGGQKKEIDCEQFALSVLAGEYSERYGDESLKSLACVARSVAVYISVFGGKHVGFDCCTDPNCCFLFGDISALTDTAQERCKAATDQTRGETLFYDGDIAFTPFTLCAGSATESIAGFNYIEPVKTTPCEQHTKTDFLPYQKITELIGASAEEIKQNSLIIYDEYGKIDFGIIGGRKLFKAQLTELFNPTSDEFFISFTDDGVKVSSNGVGHASGLSICHCDALEREQKSYEQILYHFFPKLLKKKIY